MNNTPITNNIKKNYRMKRKYNQLIFNYFRKHYKNRFDLQFNQPKLKVFLSKKKIVKHKGDLEFNNSSNQ